MVVLGVMGRKYFEEEGVIYFGNEMLLVGFCYGRER